MTSPCLTIQVIAAESTEEMLQAYRHADARADVVELRFDTVRNLQPDRLLAARGKPKLVTVRSRQQGGEAHPADRETLIRRAIKAEVEYVDLEFGDHDQHLVTGRGPTRRILSWHDHQTTPADLPLLVERMRAAADGAILKIVTYADALTDNLRIRDLLKGQPAGSLIAFCMGQKGIVSRVLARAWGSAGIYAPGRGSPASAPGQVSLEDLFDLYRFDRIGHDTRLLGVVGSPVGHSLSPLMHNAALTALDLDYRYVPLEAPSLAELLPLVSELPFAGLSVTLPHKEAIRAYLDDIDETARAVGAVNTVVRRWNRLLGSNTDVEASIAPLKAVMALKGARVAVIGAGGAARALVCGLTREGARVTVFNRTAARARELARSFGARARPWSDLRRFACDAVINATSVGLAPLSEKSPVPPGWITAPLVYDLIYNPPETALLRAAAQRGAQVIGGVEMFVHQGAEQFRRFTGGEPPVDLMRRQVLAALQGTPHATPPDGAPPRAGATRGGRTRAGATRTGAPRRRRKARRTGA